MNSIVFITSNRAKLMHAKHLAKPYKVEVRGKKYYGVAYDEPRSQDRNELLQMSYQDALNRWQKSAGSVDGFFFIEDSSVIINALSQGREIPGVDVKYWMKETSFSKLDAQLRLCGNQRAVTVRSDVLLHLPDWFRQEHDIKQTFLQFVGKEIGIITTEELKIETNLLYPWLDNRSFNKWFIPSGCNSPVSALPIEIADAHDFRRGSIGAMFDFLQARQALQDRKKHRLWPKSRFLPNLFSPILIVTGLPCAGKTTLGMHLSEKYGYYHIEASDFMKCAFYERHGTTSTLPIESFAEKVLQDEPDVVVRPVLDEIQRTKAEQVVITGFRSLREIEIFEEDYSGAAKIICWFVDSNQQLRFERSTARGRLDALTTMSSFAQRDNVQLRMGLQAIRDALSDNRIINEGTVQEYLTHCTQKLNARQCTIIWPRLDDLHERPGSLEETILIGLAKVDPKGLNPLSTTEIAHKLNELFAASDIETNKNNISRYFNFKPNALFHVEIIQGVLKYRLSATGRSRAMRFLDFHRRKDSRLYNVCKQS